MFREGRLMLFLVVKSRDQSFIPSGTNMSRRLVGVRRFLRQDYAYSIYFQPLVI